MAKILTLSTSYPRFTGDVIAPFIENISREIVNADNEIDLLLPYHPELNRQDENHINFHLYRYTTIKKLMIWGYASSMKADVKLKVTAMLLAPKVYFAALRTGSALIEKKKHQIIHAHWLLPNGYIALKLSRRFGIPFAVSLHGSDMTIAERPLFRGLAKVVLRESKWVSACSEDLRLRAIDLGCDPAKTVTIPYGVDTNLFQPDAHRMVKLRKKLRDKLMPKDRIILAVGRLVEKKGFVYLIEAIAKMLKMPRNILLVFAGDGDLRNDLQEKVYQLGIKKNVHFAGSIQRNELPIYFSGCDILVVPSVRDRYGNVDGLPNVLMEGLSSGRAVVASDIAGIPNIINNGVNGLLVAPNNPSQIAEAIEKLLDDPSLRKKLGAEARRQCLNQYTWKITGAKYAKGLKSLLQ